MAATAETTSTSDIKVPLTIDLVSSFKPAKVFTSYVGKGKSITSLSFSDRGERCITCSDDDTLQLFDCDTGKHKRSIPSLKYGAHLARFTHKSSLVIHASTKENNMIRYLSLQDQKYLRYFDGHKDKVVSMEMSPVDDTFLSAAVNDSVRLWDLRTQNSQGHLNVLGHPVVSYDPTGKVFAIALNQRSAVLLYDLRKFDHNPFLTIHLDDTAALSQVSMPPRVPVITSLDFNNESQLLIGTAGDVHYVVDSFTGQVIRRLVGHDGLEKASGHAIGMIPEAGISGQEVCWTPDGKFVISGTASGQICVWKIPTTTTTTAAVGGYKSINLLPTTQLLGHEGPSRVVRFNPRLAQFASAGSQTAFWLPETLAADDL